MTRHLPKAALAATAATLLLGLAAPHATAAPDRDDTPTTPAAPAAPAAPSKADRAAAHEAVTAPGTLDTLSRFFAREGAVSKEKKAKKTKKAKEAKARPRIQGGTVPVYYLSPEFVAGKRGAPVARLEFLAGKAVSADGRTASLWTVKQKGTWQVVNIATGDDETHYARVGAEKLPGGTVFHEPQIDAWYVQRDARVLPLDKDASAAIGADGTSLAAYRERVGKAYGDKLPGSAYDRSGKAGGFAQDSAGAAKDSKDAKDAMDAKDSKKNVTEASVMAAPGSPPTDPAVTVAATAAGAGALAALTLTAARAIRLRRR
ncbi:hypothetical protein [Streptomyces sp. NPDC002851]